MKKILISFSLLILNAIPLITSAATLEQDLYFGMRANPNVKILQQFLSDQGLYMQEITGNFLSYTLQSVMKFQEQEGIMPAQGYVGPKTRARINMLLEQKTPLSSREQQIAALKMQIQAIKAQIADLIAKRKDKSLLITPIALPSLTPTPTPLASMSEILDNDQPSPSPSPSSLAVLTPSPIPSETAASSPAPVKELRISGNVTQSFPDSTGQPFKLGNITISNTTDHDILFNQFQLDIYDSMNSAMNRGKTVLFKIRNGIAVSDELISETKFEINRDAPSSGEELRRQLDVSYPILIKAGQTYVSGIWIENLDYVIDGSFRIEMLAASLNNGVTPQGGFTFILTKSQ